MFLQDGDSPVLARLKDEIINEHPGINLIDAGNKYDMHTFNRCEKADCLMETLDICAKTHRA